MLHNISGYLAATAREEAKTNPAVIALPRPPAGEVEAELRGAGISPLLAPVLREGAFAAPQLISDSMTFAREGLAHTRQLGTRYATTTVLARMAQMGELLDELWNKVDKGEIKRLELPLALTQIATIAGVHPQDLEFLLNDSHPRLQMVRNVFQSFTLEYERDLRSQAPTNILFPDHSVPSISAQLLSKYLQLSMRQAPFPEQMHVLFNKLTGISPTHEVHPFTLDCNRLPRFDEFVQKFYETFKSDGHISVVFSRFDVKSFTRYLYTPSKTPGLHIYREPGTDAVAHELKAYRFKSLRGGSCSCDMSVGTQPNPSQIRIYCEIDNPQDEDKLTKVVDIRVPFTEVTFRTLMKILDEFYPHKFRVSMDSDF